uniref:ANK_REP_REGION domain-containing protein n=1 Tax=Macrostomum lignano TaxID=282301 RepID=A0A1I8F784_9PLAT
ASSASRVGRLLRRSLSSSALACRIAGSSCQTGCPCWAGCISGTACSAAALSAGHLPSVYSAHPHLSPSALTKALAKLRTRLAVLERTVVAPLVAASADVKRIACTHGRRRGAGGRTAEPAAVVHDAGTLTARRCSRRRTSTRSSCACLRVSSSACSHRRSPSLPGGLRNRCRSGVSVLAQACHKQRPLGPTQNRVQVSEDDHCVTLRRLLHLGRELAREDLSLVRSVAGGAYAQNRRAFRPRSRAFDPKQRQLCLQPRVRSALQLLHGLVGPPTCTRGSSPGALGPHKCASSASRPEACLCAGLDDSAAHASPRAPGRSDWLSKAAARRAEPRCRPRRFAYADVQLTGARLRCPLLVLPLLAAEVRGVVPYSGVQGAAYSRSRGVPNRGVSDSVMPNGTVRVVALICGVGDFFINAGPKAILRLIMKRDALQALLLLIARRCRPVLRHGRLHRGRRRHAAEDEPLRRPVLRFLQLRLRRLQLGGGRAATTPAWTGRARPAPPTPTPACKLGAQTEAGCFRLVTDLATDGGDSGAPAAARLVGATFASCRSWHRSSVAKQRESLRSLLHRLARNRRESGSLEQLLARSPPGQASPARSAWRQEILEPASSARDASATPAIRLNSGAPCACSAAPAFLRAAPSSPALTVEPKAPTKNDGEMSSSTLAELDTASAFNWTMYVRHLFQEDEAPASGIVRADASPTKGTRSSLLKHLGKLPIAQPQPSPSSMSSSNSSSCTSAAVPAPALLTSAALPTAANVADNIRSSMPNSRWNPHALGSAAERARVAEKLHSTPVYLGYGRQSWGLSIASATGVIRRAAALGLALESRARQRLDSLLELQQGSGGPDRAHCDPFIANAYTLSTASQERFSVILLPLSLLQSPDLSTPTIRPSPSTVGLASHAGRTLERRNERMSNNGGATDGSAWPTGWVRAAHRAYRMRTSILRAGARRAGGPVFKSRLLSTPTRRPGGERHAKDSGVVCSSWRTVRAIISNNRREACIAIPPTPLSEAYKRAYVPANSAQAVYSEVLTRESAMKDLIAFPLHHPLPDGPPTGVSRTLKEPVRNLPLANFRQANSKPAAHQTRGQSKMAPAGGLADDTEGGPAVEPPPDSLATAGHPRRFWEGGGLAADTASLKNGKQLPKHLFPGDPRISARAARLTPEAFFPRKPAHQSFLLQQQQPPLLVGSGGHAEAPTRSQTSDTSRGLMRQQRLEPIQSLCVKLEPEALANAASSSEKKKRSGGLLGPAFAPRQLLTLYDDSRSSAEDDAANAYEESGDYTTLPSINCLKIQTLRLATRYIDFLSHSAALRRTADDQPVQHPYHYHQQFHHLRLLIIITPSGLLHSGPRLLSITAMMLRPDVSCHGCGCRAAAAAARPAEPAAATVGLRIGVLGGRRLEVD